MSESRIAIYPGSFDPLTYGHLDVALRAKRFFDKIVFVVANNSAKKNYFFTPEERVEVIRSVIQSYPGLEVTSTSGAVVDKARELKATAMIRGLRAFTDFESEYALHAVYEYMDPQLETLYFMARREETFISSSEIRELFNYGKDVSDLVPPQVLSAMRKKKEGKN